MEEFDITREAQDEFAVQSHKKAFMATRMQKFVDEIVPVEIVKKVAGQEVAREQIVQDETINPALSVQKAALYPAIFKKNGSVTPANSCGISDGASAVLICTAEKAREMGWEPMAHLRLSRLRRGRARAHGHCPRPGHAHRCWPKPGSPLDDMELVEVNEAFAGQVLSVSKAMQRAGHPWDWEKLNVNGGAIALGHPVGSSGSPHCGDPVARNEAPPGALRPGIALRRRRPGQRSHSGTQVTIRTNINRAERTKEQSDVYL